ncbi:non-hydrolyzing UDP-N-acetylglucosamine 2-epimerase [Natranaerobius thermophilus]|uniref:UDP-N-acetylglucosamine 2-epimerase (non-hydrolyzing) n=1 Tax=Natranaerobius thermophilus (strain ATCC BAA-1301 / DSM 18059 / JW/NM-WN-LF) TaxID=457570 RepID=B2A3H3_NATTJ|nr:UDP-N-acetylglucosamine 2-epimerase (non-hydrolyzing) [Natranaerobius thermophilus]ACB86402.1 UDP-N-Acetylglucosamine 2-epimerase [Natranaerobius thermophilus JW/NM-WN-LF]
MKHRVVSVFGTRPEAIKMAPLVSAIESSPNLTSSVVVTAQHREMLDQVLDLFKIEPDYDLDIMKTRQSLSEITSNVILKLEQILQDMNPHLLLVHGDTTTTFASALSAYYQKISIGHVEAGLRTWDKYAPFPEEMNRNLVGPLADLHFAPTSKAKNNLLTEGISENKIFVTGNTVVDALKTSVQPQYQFQDPKLASLDLPSLSNRTTANKKLITLEVHRRENWGAPMKNIFKGIKKLVDEFQDVMVVFPVHRNPAVRETAYEILGNHDRIILTDPLPTRDFHNLIARSYLVLTDSGGIQEEAPSFGVPVLVVREKTEREEGLKQGTVMLIGREQERIYQESKKLLTDKELYETMRKQDNPYGDGFASSRIVSAIEHYYGHKDAPEPDYKVSPV